MVDRDFHFIEGEIAIVFSVESELRPYIANFDAGERLMCLDIPNLNDKILDSLLFSIDHQLRLADHMSAG